MQDDKAILPKACSSYEPNFNKFLDTAAECLADVDVKCWLADCLLSIAKKNSTDIG